MGFPGNQVSVSVSGFQLINGTCSCQPNHTILSACVRITDQDVLASRQGDSAFRGYHVVNGYRARRRHVNDPGGQDLQHDISNEIAKEIVTVKLEQREIHFKV